MQREKIRQVVETLPDEVDVDAFMERILLLEKIEIAERQLANGEGIPHEEVKRRITPAACSSC